jgi:hypothetical protein
MPSVAARAGGSGRPRTGPSESGARLGLIAVVVTSGRREVISAAALGSTPGYIKMTTPSAVSAAPAPRPAPIAA